MDRKFEWAQDRKYTLNGEPVDVVSFIQDNQFEDVEISMIQRLQVANDISFGGGAFPLSTLRRTR